MHVRVLVFVQVLVSTCTDTCTRISKYLQQGRIWGGSKAPQEPPGLHRRIFKTLVLSNEVAATFLNLVFILHLFQKIYFFLLQTKKTHTFLFPLFWGLGGESTKRKLK